jgi:hypothetical protein
MAVPCPYTLWKHFIWTFREGFLEVLLKMDDLEIYKVVLEVCIHYQVDPNNDDYFDDLLSQYTGPDTPESLSDWLSPQIPKLFKAVDKRPIWIQEPNWPFSEEGYPMIFIGQIDVKMTDKPPSERLYHDDTSFYLFRSETGESTVIKQQY